VEREPGETTARRSPQRANSSTKAEARAVLALVGSMVGDFPTYAVEKSPGRLEAVCLERVLVDLDAEPGPGGGVEHAVTQLALDRGDGRGEEPLGGEAMGETRPAARPRETL